jgi:5-methylcytosine-specific restriction protein A
MTKKISNAWTDAELDACLTAYLGMQKKQRQGLPFVKAQVHRELQSDKRTAKSIEYRMQNLSSLMKELSLPIVNGYQPAGHLGSGIRARVLSMMEARGVYSPLNYLPTVNDEELVYRAEMLRDIDLTMPPTGIQNPASITSIQTGYVRDPKTRAWILKNSNGFCEGCGQKAPFLTNSGSPFLEIHHVRRLADYGSDRPSNTVALCPNCHRRCHISEDREVFTDFLYKKIARLKREPPN